MAPLWMAVNAALLVGRVPCSIHMCIRVALLSYPPSSHADSLQLRLLPTHIAVRIFIQLDIRSLARCDRVCKRWQKSSTLNYGEHCMGGTHSCLSGMLTPLPSFSPFPLHSTPLISSISFTKLTSTPPKLVTLNWNATRRFPNRSRSTVWFLQNRALTLPSLSNMLQGKNRKVDDGPEFFDPYDKTPRLSALPAVPVPASTAPQWSKAESKRAWKSVFHTTLARSDPSRTEDDDDHPYRVKIDSLQSSGYSTPSRHQHAGLGSGNAQRWNDGPTGASGSLTPSERKLAAREGYKAMGGRKARTKRKMGGEFGARDKGGASQIDGEDQRFTCPF